MAAQQQQSQADNSLAPLWIMALLIITLLLLWYFARGAIVSAIFHVKLFEAYLVTFFSHNLDPVIGFMQDSLIAPEQVTPDQLLLVTTMVGEWVRWPTIFILVIFAFVLMKSDVKSRYKKNHSMLTLRKQEYVNWPQISTVINLDLVKMPLDEGGWAMAMAPLSFAKKYQILRLEKVISDPSKKRFVNQDDNIRFAIHRGEAKRIFTMQLGSYWEGIDSLNLHTKALFAMFAAKMNRDREGYSQFSAQVNRSAITGKLDFSGMKELLEKHRHSKPVKRITSRHAYVYTVMATMISVAREDGVLPSSDFLWLKPLDRRLWYILNCVGRQTPYCEVAGIFGHWITERALRRKSLVPMVNEAVTAIEVAVREIKYMPERDAPEES